MYDKTADCLSRLPLPMTEPCHEADVEMVVLVSGDCAAVPVEQFKETCNRCPILQKVHGYVSRGWPCTAKGINPNVLPYFCIWNELAVQEDYLIWGTHRVIMPTELKPS